MCSSSFLLALSRIDTLHLALSATHRTVVVFLMVPSLCVCVTAVFVRRGGG